MNRIVRILTCFLLIFNGTGALYGGGLLLLNPDGSSLQMSPEYLQHSPFTSYLIPGIILFIVNGLFSFFVLGSLLRKHRNAPALVLVQGLLLAGWIILQVLMIQIIYFLHVIMGVTGLALIGYGWVLNRRSA